MAFEPVKKVKLAQQVAGSIRDAIVTGAYGPGDSLPSERTLAEQFAVNRSSVREALHRLEAWGLVEVRQGGATRVRDFLSTAGLQLLPYLLAPGGQLDPKMLADLLEMRVMMLRWTGARAAERATPDGVAALEHILDALDAATEPAAIQALDFDFYERLVAMTGNGVLGMVSHAIRRVYLENRALFQHLFQPPLFTTVHHHRALQAIRAGDSKAAEAAMEAHALGPLAPR